MDIAIQKRCQTCEKANYNMDELYSVISKLANDEPLEERYRDHSLDGNWSGHRELHIRPD